MQAATYTQSRENPYRYGVLEGNHVEDRFGIDHLSRHRKELLPTSTMKDDYRWYNSKLFEQRDDILKRYPVLDPQIHNNKKLKPFLNTPAHMVNQEEYRNKPLPGQEDSKGGNQQEGNAAALSPTLNVCCPQEDNLQRHGMTEGLLPPQTTGDQLMDDMNALKNGNPIS